MVSPFIGRVVAIGGAVTAAISVALLLVWNNPLYGVGDGRVTSIDTSTFPPQLLIGLLGMILYGLGIFFLQKNAIKVRPWFLLPILPLYILVCIHSLFVRDFLDILFIFGFVFSGLVLLWGFAEIVRIAIAK